MKKLPHYTFGMGDRFGAEGTAQLEAVIKANSEGIQVCPVWNKSHREHTIVGTEPPSLRREADAAVQDLGWTGPYFVDADHINLDTVDGFAKDSDFFTLDVADSVGQTPDPEKRKAFIESHKKYVGSLPIENAPEPISLSLEELESAADKFLEAITSAGKIYQRILSLKGENPFATEVSIDETDTAQSPGELFCILAMIASEGIPAQTVAPKFTGRFNKGVDYVGVLDQFEKEFEQDLLVIQFAIQEFGLPDNLKLSVHSGSDKFSLYPIINRMLKQYGCGLHVKTAGTTWLEELIGLAEAGGDGLELAKQIYTEALASADSLIAPYRTVVDIDLDRLPSAEAVQSWSSDQYTEALRHDATNSSYNLHFRQLLHVAFKIAAKKGDRYLDALQTHRDVIAQNVTTNLYERHIRPIFSAE